MLERLSKECTMIILDDCGTPCEIIPSSKCSRDYPRNVRILLLDDWGTPCEIIPSSRCSRDYPRNVQWYDLMTRLLDDDDCWYVWLRNMWVIQGCRLCWQDMQEIWTVMGTKVVDYAGKICSRSEQWGMTTFKCMISALLIYMFETGA